MDIAFGLNNEREFLKVQKQLGIGRLLILSSLRDFGKGFTRTNVEDNTQKKTQSSNKDQASKNDVVYGVFSNKADEVKQAVRKGLFVASATNDRSVLESCPSIVFELETVYPRDSLHQRQSGLNHVLLKVMREKKTRLGISFFLLLTSQGRERAQVLGRMKQNITLARKYNVPVDFLSCAREPYQLRDLSRITGLYSRTKIIGD